MLKGYNVESAVEEVERFKPWFTGETTQKGLKKELFQCLVDFGY